MRVAIVAAVAVSVAATLAFACSDDTPVSPDPSDAGGGGSETASPPGPTNEDGGNRAPSGCLLKTTDYTVGAKAENVERTDVTNAADWTNVEGALSPDDKFATVTLNDGQESSVLRVSGFGLAVPATAETWGIEVELKRRAPDGGVEDSKVDVEVEGKTSRFKYVNTPWPTSIVGTHAYGQAIDTWGVDLFPTDVNKTSFAAKLTVKRTANAVGAVTANVESLRVAVHFCPEPIKK